jgi:predicted tellurium resistance membrane protein TerC
MPWAWLHSALRARNESLKYKKPYLIFTMLVWLPWGLACIFNTDVILAIIGVTSVHPTGNTDIRVMYGGVQFAVGLMAAFALYDGRYFEKLLWTLAFLGSCMAISRLYGLLVDGSGTVYTWGVLGYEAFAGASAIGWLVLLPRLQAQQASNVDDGAA